MSEIENTYDSALFRPLEHDKGVSSATWVKHSPGRVIRANCNAKDRVGSDTMSDQAITPPNQFTFIHSGWSLLYT